VNWDTGKATEVYNISHWSEGYFAVNHLGHLTARPRPDGPEVDLHALTGALRGLGLTPPVLVRFTGILHHRIESLCAAFDQAMAAHGYGASYTPAYPIKVNQQRGVVSEILANGQGRVGLEAGSKPELMAVLALASGAGDMVLCNGYKDREYVRLALMGQALGHAVHIVVEKPSELDLVLEEAAALDVVPTLGVRLRLASVGFGKWQNTGGEKSKFGLSPAQVLELVSRLRESGRLEWLRLMHFHLGSQIPNIRDIQSGLKEAARYYAALRGLGADIRVLDVGGGLAVDYQGTGSRDFCSMNYSIPEYANNVVHALWEVCQREGLPYPDIVTESGRAMTAHHAMLITEVIDVAAAPGRETPAAATDDEGLVIRDLWQAHLALSPRNALETYHDAQHWLAEAQAMFVHGVLSLTERARAEALYFAICQRVRGMLSPGFRSHREVLDELNEKLADRYLCNFSLFQSLPDAWAIDQVFPVVPLHRLDEAPMRRAVIHDLTCDSDGQLKSYVDAQGPEASLPLHASRVGEPYLLGIFMLGAYQEILGDVHNLFGDSHSVNVEVAADGSLAIRDPLHGDSVGDVLRYVHMEVEALMAAYRRQGQGAGLTPERLEAYLARFRAGLDGYTYLEE
jgi:arginine decarboxylase